MKLLGARTLAPLDILAGENPMLGTARRRARHAAGTSAAQKWVPSRAAARQLRVS